MKIFSFTIPGRLAGSNEIKYADRSHWSKGAKLRKQDLENCRWHILGANIGTKISFKEPVSVSFVWVEPNAKRDLDNITGGQKAILDALVNCRVLKGDTRKFVSSLIHIFPDPDADNPRIEVTVQSDEAI